MKYKLGKCSTGFALFVGLSIGCYGQADTTPPQLVSFSMSPTTVDVSKGPVTVYGRMAASDNISGFSYAGGSMWGYVQMSLGNTHFLSTPFKVMNGSTANNVIVEFTIVMTQFLPAGIFSIDAIVFMDAANNMARITAADLQGRGFPSTITVTNNPTATSIATIATIPHLATGEGWQTTVRASGTCVDGCTLDISTYDNNGVVINTTTSTVPASPVQWVKSIVMPTTSKLATGWIEVKATSKSNIGVCASALFTNSISKQEASSSSSCIHPSGWESGGFGTMQYFYSHQSGYTSGVALLNKATGVLSVRLEWRDDSDTVVASRTISLLPRQQMSFTSNEAVGKYGRFSVSPDPLMTQAQRDQFSKSIYSLGFQFSPFGSFTQLSAIN